MRKPFVEEPNNHPKSVLLQLPVGEIAEETMYSQQKTDLAQPLTSDNYGLMKSKKFIKVIAILLLLVIV